MTYTGRTIHGYEISDQIGSGGFGEVYRAIQLSVDRHVAIKVILPQYVDDPTFRADFKAEAQLVAQLEHTNIVPLYDFWQDEQGAFLVMRYVRGGSLKEMLDKQGALSLTRTVRLIEQIAEALAAAHDADIVHRDLKPANILIDLRGNAYLTDFGIAKRLTDDSKSDQQGAMRGTVAYMTPEQIQGQAVSPQTDIYTLGIMLYEMLAGQHPFHKSSTASMLYKHIQEPFPDIHTIRDDLPSGIDAVLHRATAKTPTDRYADVLEVVTDLKAIVSETSRSAPPTPLPTKQEPATTAERNRQAILQNVRKSWIQGALENSLYHAVQVELDLKVDTGQVTTPWDTWIQTFGSNDRITDMPILDVFDLYNGKLLIVGDPGGGKTTTLLMLARDLLKRAETDPAHPIPVVLNLSSWAESQQALAEWIVEELNRIYQVPLNIGRNWVDNDELLLLLDGLDEVTLNARDACVTAINTYRQEHGFVDLVVCSRIADYEMLDTQLIMNGAVVIQPMNTEQIEDYFRQLGTQFEPIVQMLREDEALLEVCQSPLMLSIIALTYGDGNTPPPEGMEVETLRRVIFDAYVERAFKRGGRNADYPVAYVSRQLNWLARQMQDHGKSIFQIEALQPTWLSPERTRQFPRVYTSVTVFVTYTVWTIATLLYLLPRELEVDQLIINSLLGGLMGAGFGFAISNKAYDRWWMTFVVGAFMLAGLVGRGDQPFPGSLLPAIAFSIFYAVTLNLLKAGYYNASIITPVERLSFSRKNVPVIPVVFAAFILTFVILNSQAPHQHPDRFLLAYFVTLPIIFSLPAILTGLESITVDDSSHPNQGIFSSIENGVLAGAISAVVYFLAVFISQVILHDISRALVWGLFSLIWYFLWVGFLVGFAPALQHLVLRWMLHRDAGIAWNYAAFLDHASRLILLRRVGGSYTFIHRSLLEYFAALEPKKNNA